MGHGSFPVTIKKVGEGVYEASEIFFTMPGRWDVHFELYDNQGKIVDESLWPIEL